MLKSILVVSLIVGASFAFLFTVFAQPNYTQGLKQSTEIMVKRIWGAGR